MVSCGFVSTVASRLSSGLHTARIHGKADTPVWKRSSLLSLCPILKSLQPRSPLQATARAPRSSSPNQAKKDGCTLGALQGGSMGSSGGPAA